MTPLGFALYITPPLIYSHSHTPWYFSVPVLCIIPPFVLLAHVLRPDVMPPPPPPNIVSSTPSNSPSYTHLLTLPLTPPPPPPSLISPSTRHMVAPPTSTNTPPPPYIHLFTPLLTPLSPPHPPPTPLSPLLPLPGTWSHHLTPAARVAAVVRPLTCPAVPLFLET